MKSPKRNAHRNNKRPAHKQAGTQNKTNVRANGKTASPASELPKAPPKAQPAKKSGYVAIIGRPNAGKSTLLNAILDTELSIVSPKAQTTRERVQGIYSEERGQIVFVDTPGIHQAKEGGINEYMVQEARQSLDAPDVIWYLVDPNSKIEAELAVINLLEKFHWKHAKSDPTMDSTLAEKTTQSAPVMLVFSKSDQPGAKDRVSTLRYQIFDELESRGIQAKPQDFEVSGLKKKSITHLLGVTFATLPEGQPFYPDDTQMSDRPMKFFAAEKVRQQLFSCLGEELPYSCAVEVTRYSEDVIPVRIEATIHVERESQKGMVIGKGGLKIKEIGQQARAEIEKMVGQKIFLGLQVNFLKDWSKDKKQLKRMGYVLGE